MNALTLAYANLRHNPARTLFNILLFAIGTALIALVLGLGSRFEQNLSRNLHGIDMVVGAKGSPLQLVLSAVLHADIPTGNIPLKDAVALEQNPMIKSAIPVALGDNVAGYRIVGTTPDYVAQYGGQLASGRLYGGTAMEAVLGSEVAAKLNIAPGQKFAGSHGLTPGGELHSFAPYTVVGILKPSGTIMDRLVLTPVESVWYVHENDDDEPVDTRLKPENREITALLVRYRSPLAVASLPRYINAHTNFQAASPAMEAFRLRQVLGMGADTLKAVGAALMALAGLGLLVSMGEAVRQRLYDLALMRCFGGSPAKVVGLVVLEGLAISLVGGLVGIAAAVGLTGAAASRLLGGQLGGATPPDVPTLAAILAAVLALGVAGSLIPALRVYRLSIPSLLANR